MKTNGEVSGLIQEREREREETHPTVYGISTKASSVALIPDSM